MTVETLVTLFADAVVAQKEALSIGDSRAGNRAANRYIRAWERIRLHGNNGRDALMVLFKDKRADVRAMAAAFLLKHSTAEAKRILEEVASGDGLAAFGASQALQRWEEGDWHLDPH